MSRSKTSRTNAELEETPVVVPEEPKEPETPEPAAVEQSAPAEVPAPLGREMTAREYVRGLGPLGVAFQTTVGLASKRTVKLTKSQWDAKYQEFMTQSRR